MARLPSGRFLVQQIGDDVIVFEQHSEREVMRVPLVIREEGKPPRLNGDGVARAQKVIHDSDLGDEDKSFAHFWCGYFYGCASS